MKRAVIAAMTLSLVRLAHAEPEKITHGGSHAFNLFLAGDHIYWGGFSMDDGGGPPMVLSRAPRVGGPIEDLSHRENPVSGVFVSGKNVFFLDQGTAMSGPRCRDCAAPRSFLDGAVHRMDARGKIVRLAKKQHMPLSLVGDRTHLYWVTPGDDAPDTGQVMRISHKGGAAKRLAKLRLVRAVAVDERHAYVVVDGTPGSVWRLAKTGGKPTKLGEVASPRLLVVDATHVYVAGGREIVKLPKTGGAPVVLAADQADPLGLALDETRVYWTTYQGHTVMAIAKEGGTPVTLAKDQQDAAGLAVDATHVYWSAAGGLRRTPKP